MKRSISYVLVTMLGILGVFAPASAGDLIRAKGEFSVAIDFASLALQPVDENCLLTVEGEVTFTGTLEGVAAARTRALASATCDEVASLPPGAYEDVFTSAFEFAGKVDGRPIVADFNYRGDTAIGGEIEGLLIPSNGLRGRLFVDAIVAAGGTYKGFLKEVNF